MWFGSIRDIKVVVYLTTAFMIALLLCSVATVVTTAVAMVTSVTGLNVWSLVLFFLKAMLFDGSIPWSDLANKRHWARVSCCLCCPISVNLRLMDLGSKAEV